MLLDLLAETLLEQRKVIAVQTRHCCEQLQELDSPVARVVLRLVLEVVSAFAIPDAHTDVVRYDIFEMIDIDLVCRCNSREHGLDHVLKQYRVSD
jgi:hypothetical protein